METFKIGQTVKFKPTSIGFIVFGEVHFTVAELLSENNKDVYYSYPHPILLKSEAYGGLHPANPEELELIVNAEPEVSALSRGIEILQAGGDTVYAAVSSLPNHVGYASELCISSASDAAASVSDAIGSCVSAIGDTISSSTDIIGNIAGGIGDIAGSIDL